MQAAQRAYQSEPGREFFNHMLYSMHRARSEQHFEFLARVGPVVARCAWAAYYVRDFWGLQTEGRRRQHRLAGEELLEGTVERMVVWCVRGDKRDLLE